MMERLDFRLPEFLRTAWVSHLARNYWEPKIHSIANCWPYVERASILQKLRPGSLQSISPDDLPEAQNWAISNAVQMSIVGMNGAHENFGNASLPYVHGESFTYRVYFGSDAIGFLESWRDSDNDAIGHYLGFPECCTRFFDTYWNKEGWRDLTYPAIRNRETGNLIYNNVLLKHIGVRPIFHLPCSFSCEESCQIGARNYNLMSSIGLEREARWSQELVSMPMEWSSLHGIAILTTPIFKLIYNTDPLPKEVKIHLLSDNYPEHGASGNKFPFTNVIKLRFHNGFGTKEGMEEGHKFILDSLPQVVTGRVLDLGSGDGTLLSSIRNRHPYTTLFGVDSQKVPIRELCEGDEYWRMDIYGFRWDLKFDLVLLAIQRLSEVDKDKAAMLLEHIAEHADRFLLYSYDGWNHAADDLLEKYFSIVATNQKANFEAMLFENKTVSAE